MTEQLRIKIEELWSTVEKIEENRWRFDWFRRIRHSLHPSDVYEICMLGAEVLKLIWCTERQVVLRDRRDCLDKLKELKLEVLKGFAFDETGGDRTHIAAFWGKVVDMTFGCEGDEGVSEFCRSLPSWFSKDFADPMVAREWEKYSKKAQRVFAETRGIVMAVADRIIKFLLMLDKAQCLPIYCKIVCYRLREFRGHFISVAKACGPYALRRNGRWESGCPEKAYNEVGMLSVELPHSLDDRFDIKFETFDGKRHYSWPIKVDESDIQYNDYETNLFETWLYENGKYFVNPELAGKAYWCLDAQAVGEIDICARIVEEALSPIEKTGRYEQLCGSVKKIARNGEDAWKPCHVRWTYIKELDEVIKEVEVARRELTVGDEGGVCNGTLGELRNWVLKKFELVREDCGNAQHNGEAIYRCVKEMFFYAAQAALDARTCVEQPAGILVDRGLYVEEYWKLLNELLADDWHDNWPKNVPTVFGDQSGKSAMHVAIKFSYEVYADIMTGWHEIGVGRIAEHPDLESLSLTDERFGKYQAAAAKGLIERLPPESDWPSWQVRQDRDALLCKMEEEYEKACDQRRRVAEARRGGSKEAVLASIHKVVSSVEKLARPDGDLENLSEQEMGYADAAVIEYLTGRYGEQDDALGNWLRDWHECPEAFDLWKGKIREVRANQALSGLRKVENTVRQEGSVSTGQGKMKIEQQSAGNDKLKTVHKAIIKALSDTLKEKKRTDITRDALVRRTIYRVGSGSVNGAYSELKKCGIIKQDGQDFTAAFQHYKENPPE